MRRFIKIIVLFFLFISGSRLASGQITIKRETIPEAQPLELKLDESLVNPQITRPHYMTRPMILAERRRVRKERNSFELKLNLSANQTYYDNWAKGGSNFLNINSSIYAKHIYKKERLSLTSYLDAGLGVNLIDSTTYKNSDKLILDFSANWNISEAWSYSGQLRGETQFMDGYKNHTDTILRSTFMSPGTVTVAFGFTYAPKNTGLKASISPIGGKMLFVLNDTLSKQGLNGIEKGKHIKSTLGSNIKIEFNRDFGKQKQINYRTTANGFYDYRISPQVTWTNVLTLKATKWLATTVKWDLIYDESVTKGLREGEYLQCKYEIGVGLQFNYNSKSKK